MERLIFIDDDETELDAFLKVVKGKFTCVPVQWPKDAATLSTNLSPDIIVSDLYLPSFEGDREPTVAEKEAAEQSALRVSAMFAQLYGDQTISDKARLQLTMRAISRASEVLKMQWSSLGQSPSNGIQLMAMLRRHFPKVPFVFYSRKINPEDVIRVLEAGADDAIRKGAMSDDAVIRRINMVLNKSAALSNQPADVAEPGYSGHTFLTRLKMTTLPDSSGKWLTFGGKLVALATAVVTFLLARAKLLDWIHKGGTGAASRLDSIFGLSAASNCKDRK